MNILFTICGRAGSKGMKNKNLKNFLGYPLAFYSVSVIKMYMEKNKNHNFTCVLNTDSNELINLFNEKLNHEFEIILRNKELSSDTASKIDVISNSYETMVDRNQRDYDIVVDLDITSPLRTLNDLSNLINTKNEDDSDITFSVTESRRNPYFNMVKKTDNGYVRVIDSEFNTRQEAPELYDMNASLYAYTPEFLKSKKSIFQGKISIIKMLDTAVLDIDSEKDYEMMEVIAKYLIDNNPDFRAVYDNIDSITKDK